MRKVNVYVFRNIYKGWGIIEDSRHIDTSKALFFENRNDVLRYCDINKLNVIRVCK